MSPGHWPDGPLRVFLSHTSDLADDPQPISFVAAAIDAVGSAGHAVLDMRYFYADENNPSAVCREHLQTADVFVGILGYRYGSLVPGRNVSYCEFEFTVACELDLPRLMFLQRNDVLSRYRPPDDSRQEQFRERTANDRTITYFRTPEDLRMQVGMTLMHHNQRRLRRHTEGFTGGWGWWELQSAIRIVVPEAVWCAEYLAGLVIGARAEVPIEVDGNLHFVAMKLVADLAEKSVADLVLHFMKLKEHLNRSPENVSLRRRVEANSQAVVEMSRYLAALLQRFPEAAGQIRSALPTGPNGPVPPTEMPVMSEVATLDALRRSGDWPGLAEAARRHVDARESELRGRARSDLLDALLASGRAADRVEAARCMDGFVRRPEAEALDFVRAAAASARTGDMKRAGELMRTALERWPEVVEVRRFALQVALRTGDAELRRQARDCRGVHS